MDRKSFDGNRWMVVYGKYEGLEGYAVNELYKAVQQYVPYILTAHDTENVEKFKDFHLIIMGTGSSNGIVKKLALEGVFKPQTLREGYSIKVCPSYLNPERKMILLSGADDNGLLYGVRDFEHYYADPARYTGGYVYNTPYRVFVDEMPDFEASSAPAIQNRGLWTWGHVIYDYRNYIDNMSRWKMNILTLWNDFAPLNARDVADYAHSRGIKVIWGYTWCWGEEVDPTDAKQLAYWTDRVIKTYEEQYARLGADGIYFQTFTEHSGPEIKGKSAAELSVSWVNHIAGALLERHPDLWIQFGLHAEHVKKEYAAYKNIDPRLNITWEDAGSFPFHHNSGRMKDYEATLAFTNEICRLRGEAEDFGVVWKGMSMLDWPGFEHQKGAFILGESKEELIKDKTREKEFIWKYTQAYWTKHLRYALEMAKSIKESGVRQTSAAMLVEDGLWEGRQWGPVAMFAEAAWNADANAEDIIEKLMLTRDAAFV